MTQKKLNKSKLVVIMLAILLVIALVYIAFDKYSSYRQMQYIKAYQEGYNQGVYNMVLSLYQQTENCQPTTVNLGNVTRQVIDVGCIAPSK